MSLKFIFSVSANITHWGVDDVMGLIQNFGALYDIADLQNITSEKYLDYLLSKLYGDNYDVTSLMREVNHLSPSGWSVFNFYFLFPAGT